MQSTGNPSTPLNQISPSFDSRTPEEQDDLLNYLGEKVKQDWAKSKTPMAPVVHAAIPFHPVNIAANISNSPSKRA